MKEVRTKLRQTQPQRNKGHRSSLRKYETFYENKTKQKRSFKKNKTSFFLKKIALYTLSKTCLVVGKKKKSICERLRHYYIIKIILTII